MRPSRRGQAWNKGKERDVLGRYIGGMIKARPWKRFEKARMKNAGFRRTLQSIFCTSSSSVGGSVLDMDGRGRRRGRVGHTRIV